METHAPTWLVQLPWLERRGDREALRRDLLGVTKERMLREMAEALEVLTATTPLVLVLEDLHWSDYSTLDLLGMLGAPPGTGPPARRRELSLGGRHRHRASRARAHRRSCGCVASVRTCRSQFLREVDVAAYLAHRFARQ